MTSKPTYAQLEKRIKELEHLKQVEHERLLSLLESIPYGVYISDQNCNVQYVNPVIKKEFGTIDGRKCYDYLHDRSAICPFCKNDSVCISVSDSGPGIGKELRNQIFDPFYTTKSNSSGIGLSICHRIISDHGESLELANSESSGAAFIIKLPFSRDTDKK